MVIAFLNCKNYAASKLFVFQRYKFLTEIAICTSYAIYLWFDMLLRNKDKGIYIISQSNKVRLYRIWNKYIIRAIASISLKIPLHLYCSALPNKGNSFDTKTVVLFLCLKRLNRAVCRLCVCQGYVCQFAFPNGEILNIGFLRFFLYPWHGNRESEQFGEFTALWIHIRRLSSNID